MIVICNSKSVPARDYDGTRQSVTEDANIVNLPCEDDTVIMFGITFRLWNKE